VKNVACALVVALGAGRSENKMVSEKKNYNCIVSVLPMYLRVVLIIVAEVTIAFSECRSLG
jgi:hypothetical protein